MLTNTHSLDSFFLTVVPKASSASGTGCPASRSTLISSPARGLSVSPLKNVCARPALQRGVCSGLGHAQRAASYGDNGKEPVHEAAHPCSMRSKHDCRLPQVLERCSRFPDVVQSSVPVLPARPVRPMRCT